MSREVLTVRAELEDDLSRPLRKVRRGVDDLGDEIRSTGAQAAVMGGQFGKLSRMSGPLTRGIGRLASTIGRALVSAAKAGAMALGALAVGAGVALTKVIGMASDAGESSSKFATVFANDMEEMTAWTERMHDQFGITTKALHDAGATFGVFGKAAGVADDQIASFSQDMVQAGIDLGSFYNMPHDEVFQAIQSGLAGQTEPLRKFGIFMSEASLNAFALEQGISKSTKEMSDAEKVQLRQAFILANMGDAAGDAERTQDSLANTTKALKGRISEAATVIGTAFMPYAERAAAWANDMAQGIMPRLRDELDNVTAAIDHWGPIVESRARDAWGALREGEGVAEAVNVALGPGLEPIVPIIESVFGVLEDVGTIIMDLLVPAVQEASSFIPGMVTPMEALRDVLGFTADNASTLVPIVGGLIAAYTTWKVLTLGLNAVTAAGNAIRFLTIASTSGLAAAQAAATTSTGALAAGTATLNAIMALNPVVLVVAALAALAAGLIIAYKRSETFRAVVERVWEWVKKAGSAIRSALGGALSWVSDKIDTVVGGLRRMREKVQGIPGIGRLIGGDTATPRAGTLARPAGAGRGPLGTTLAHHAMLESAVSGRRQVSNALYSVHGASDHRRGRALDLVGSGLGAYRTAARQAGHYAELHGAGATRHLHVAYGDTATPRAAGTATRTPAVGGTVVQVQGPLVAVYNPSSELDVEEAALRAIRRAERDREERT